MDYEKHYKDALESAKDYYDNSNISPIEKNRLSAIFPELRESEDERIKNEILEFFQCSMYCEELDTDKLKRWIAWLKKYPKREGLYYYHQDGSFTYIGQPAWEYDNSSVINPEVEKKELPTVENETSESEDERIRKAILGLTYIDRIEPILTKCSITKQDIRSWLEKQKEHKPGKQVDPADASWDAYYQRDLNKGYELGLEAGRKEQNPYELNKEYWRGYREGKNCVEDKIKEQKPYGQRDECKDCQANYAGTCKGSCEMKRKEQKPAEWSEEEEKDVSHIIRVLDDCYAYGRHDLSKTDHENLVNTLKSLRPHWKPSEEQMRALALVIDSDKPYCLPSLETLYDELKKL